MPPPLKLRSWFLLSIWYFAVDWSFSISVSELVIWELRWTWECDQQLIPWTRLISWDRIFGAITTISVVPGASQPQSLLGPVFRGEWWRWPGSRNITTTQTGSPGPRSRHYCCCGCGGHFRGHSGQLITGLWYLANQRLTCAQPDQSEAWLSSCLWGGERWDDELWSHVTVTVEGGWGSASRVLRLTRCYHKLLRHRHHRETMSVIIWCEAYN